MSASVTQRESYDWKGTHEHREWEWPIPPSPPPRVIHTNPDPNLLEETIFFLTRLGMGRKTPIIAEPFIYAQLEDTVNPEKLQHVVVNRAAQERMDEVDSKITSL